MTLRADSGTEVTFNAEGEASVSGAATFYLCRDDVDTETNTVRSRTITLSPVGSRTVTKGATCL